jgi:hypothetical protein
LTSGKFLKLVDFNQRIQMKLLLLKQAHGSPMIKMHWQILETTYEGTKLVKSTKLQMLISKFEEIKILKEETFGKFYTKISDVRNSMVSLGKSILDVKLIWKILRSLLEHFRIKVTTLEESEDLEEMKIEELVGSLQTYEYSLPPVREAKTIALKASKKKTRVSSDEDSDICWFVIGCILLDKITSM